MKNDKPNECDMSVELSVLNFWVDESGKLHNQDVALTIPYIPNSIVNFKNNVNLYFKELTEKDEWIVWESKHKKYVRESLVKQIKKGNYIITYIDKYVERNVEENDF